MQTTAVNFRLSFLSVHMFSFRSEIQTAAPPTATEGNLSLHSDKLTHPIIYIPVWRWWWRWMFSGFDTEGLPSAVWPGGETEALTRIERHLERKVSTTPSVWKFPKNSLQTFKELMKDSNSMKFIWIYFWSKCHNVNSWVARKVLTTGHPDQVFFFFYPLFYLRIISRTIRGKSSSQHMTTDYCSTGKRVETWKLQHVQHLTVSLEL